MKSLSIIRHAKTESSENYPTDLERPLTERGHKDAIHIAKVLARLTPPVDYLISSPSVRTRQTTERLVATRDEVHVVWEKDVYLASVETLFALLKQVSGEVKHVALVGHNPGMEELVSGLATGPAHRLNLRMATGALAHFELEIFHWNQLRWGCGALRLFVSPKFLRK